MWLFLGAPPEEIQGFDWLWIALAVMLDLGHYASNYAQRSSVGWGRGTGEPYPPSPR
jgi:hypothetical protein